jgi:flagellar export protein FliJ
MTRRSRLPTVLRLARLEQNRALGQLAEALGHARSVRSELTGVERAREQAEAQARPKEARSVVAATLQAALERARAWSGRALNLQPRVSAAEAHLEEKRADAARHRLRIRGLERAMERREAEIRMERRRRETRGVDELVRAARQVSETENA